MPVLERRKIVKQGGSYTVSVPRGWLRFYGLREGDSVEIEIDDVLIMRPGERLQAPSLPSDSPQPLRG